MQLLLAALWLATASAAPNDPTAVGASEPRPDPTVVCRAEPPDRTKAFAVELDRAKRLYQRGCHTWALDLLEDLDRRRRVETVDPATSIDARLYLGEVQFVLGSRIEARETFEALLVEHPNTTMGLFEHDPDVVDLFNVVKAGVRTPPPPPPKAIPVPGRPLWTYLPYGVPHFFLNKEPDRGFGWAAGQAVCASAAAGTFFYVRSRWPVETPNAEEYAKALPLRITNWAAEACFVGLYVGSQVDASRRYRARYRANVGVAVVPGGAGVSTRARF